MKERPILFSGEMIRAILEGRKTMTRRVVKPIAIDWDYPRATSPCPYGQPGDRLWVRESHWIVPKTAYWHDTSIPHQASPDGYSWAIYKEGWERSRPCGLRPSIHMPRWASRITLEVVSVRVERLQDISEEDAIAEGCVDWVESARDAYRELWESINGKGSWDANPWAWVIEFKRVAQ